MNKLKLGVVAIAFAFAFVAFAAKAEAAFLTDLTVGSTGSDVSALQTWLVDNGYLSLPAGVAKGYFGQLTKNAVKSYQASAGLPSTGYVGPMTRGKLNAGGSVSMGGGSTPTCPAGFTCTPVGSNPVVTVNGGEGNLKSFETLSGTESSVEEGDNNAKVLGVEFKADKSDMTVTRVDVDFNQTNSSYSKRINKYFHSVSLWANGSKIASQDVSEADEDNDVYSFRFTGLNVKVPNNDNKVELYVAVDANSDIDSGNAGASWHVEIPTDGIRAVDAAGLTDTYVASTDNLEETFTADTLTGVELKVSESSANPDSRDVEVSDDADTNDVTVLTFKLKAEGSDIAVDQIPVYFATTSNSVGTVNQIVKRARLFRGSSELDSKTISSSATGTARVLFDDLKSDIKIKKDETQEFSVVLDLNDVNSTAADFTNGDGVTVSLDANRVKEIDAEDSQGDSLTASKLTGSATGENQIFRSEGIVVKLVNKSAAVTFTGDTSGTKEQGTYTIDFSVKAFGEDVFLKATAAAVGTTSVGSGASSQAWSTTTNPTGASSTVKAYTFERISGSSSQDSSGNYFKITNGSNAETFRLKVVLEAKDDDASHEVKLAGVNWGLTSSAINKVYTTGLDDFKTGLLLLNIR
jgi:hypothetical protein